MQTSCIGNPPAFCCCQTRRIRLLVQPHSLVVQRFQFWDNLQETRKAKAEKQLKLQQLIASPKLQIVGLWQLLARSEDEEPSQRFKLIVKSTFLEFVQASWHILAYLGHVGPIWSHVLPDLPCFNGFKMQKSCFFCPVFNYFTPVANLQLCFFCTLFIVIIFWFILYINWYVFC